LKKKKNKNPQKMQQIALSLFFLNFISTSLFLIVILLAIFRKMIVEWEDA
jgi:hypothetical protein